MIIALFLIVVICLESHAYYCLWVKIEFGVIEEVFYSTFYFY